MSLMNCAACIWHMRNSRVICCVLMQGLSQKEQRHVRQATRVVERMLCVHPSDRPTCEELLQDKFFTDETSCEALRTTPPEKLKGVAPDSKTEFPSGVYMCKLPAASSALVTATDACTYRSQHLVIAGDKTIAAPQGSRHQANEISKADFHRRVQPAAPKGAPMKPKSQALQKKINAKKSQKLTR